MTLHKSKGMIVPKNFMSLRIVLGACWQVVLRKVSCAASWVLHNVKDLAQDGRWCARQINYILSILVIFCIFGPHYVDCGHHFVDFGRIS